MENSTYLPPVDQLLTYGDCLELQRKKKKPDYVTELQLTAEQIPELIRMATDPELLWADSESLEVWAPIHAWRSLGQLRAEAAIEPLISLFDHNDDDDWIGTELPSSLGKIGAVAIPHLQAYLTDQSHDYWSRATANDALKEIGINHPEARADVVAALMQALEQFKQNSTVLNGFILASLLDLKAVEAAPLIERAFAANRIDESIAGDWGDVQVDFKLKSRAELPQPPKSMQEMLSYFHVTSPTPKRQAAQGFAAQPKLSKKRRK